MGPLDIVVAPLRAAQLLVRAADDLNALAERARRDPDPVEDLRVATRELNSTARKIETGGRDLRHTGEVLDEHTQELISGGQDLTAVAEDLAQSLRILRATFPRLLDGLDSVEELEQSVETVAETVEPLQGVAKGVGRLTDRMTRRG